MFGFHMFSCLFREMSRGPRGRAEGSGNLVSQGWHQIHVLQKLRQVRVLQETDGNEKWRRRFRIKAPSSYIQQKRAGAEMVLVLWNTSVQSMLFIPDVMRSLILNDWQVACWCRHADSMPQIFYYIKSGLLSELLDKGDDSQWERVLMNLPPVFTAALPPEGSKWNVSAATDDSLFKASWLFS